MTIAKQSLIRAFQKLCIENSDYAMVASEYYSKILSGYYENIEWYGQYFDIAAARMDLSDAWMWAVIHTNSAIGNITYCYVEVGYEPQKDRYVDENNALLNGLPEGFRGEFWGELADSDGRLYWDTPIDAAVTTYNGDKIEKHIEPSFAPLEVGYTKFETTWMHLMSQKCLARWPYGSKDILLMFFQDDAWSQMRRALDCERR
jgi:hypothetical protein